MIRIPQFQHGKKTYFALSDTAANDTDAPTVPAAAATPSDANWADGSALAGGFNISSVLNEVGWPRSADEVETTTFTAGEYKSYIGGFKDATINLSGRWTPQMDFRLDKALNNGRRVAYVYGPMGATTGNPKYTGEAVVLGYDVSNTVGDVIGFTATLRMTSAPARAVTAF